MDIEKLEEKYNYQYSPFFKELWTDGLLDWYKGWDEPWTKERNWSTVIYPTIKDHPPILLHTGNDFQMLREDEMLNYEFYEWWNPKHEFIPFGKTGAGDLYALYKNIEIDGEKPVVLVWHDTNETQYVSKNFEDFIFRQMIEKVVNEEDLNDEFQKDIQADLGSIKKYLKPAYQEILTELYNRSFDQEIVISVEEMNKIFDKTIKFDLWNTSFDQEVAPK